MEPWFQFISIQRIKTRGAWHDQIKAWTSLYLLNISSFIATYQIGIESHEYVCRVHALLLIIPAMEIATEIMAITVLIAEPICAFNLQIMAERTTCNDNAKGETQELAFSPMWRLLKCYCWSSTSMAKPLRSFVSREAETTCPFWNIRHLLTQLK